MKISVCYIVKNEEKNLRQSLESLNNAADEIIVVDTGSTDKTLNVAENFGAKIFNETWQDDFSAPRNVALSHATGDWIIFLDADEYFTEDTSKNIRIVIEKFDKTKMNGLLTYLVNVDEDKDNQILDSTFLLRIFRNLRGLAYVGKIHEELRLNGKELTNLFALPPKFLTLIHTGYSDSLNKSKAKRNLKMLLSEIESTDEPQKFYGYIAQCYNGLDDFKKAKKYAKLDIEFGANRSTFSSSSYRILLDILSRDKSKLHKRTKIARQAAEKFCDQPDFHAELAECLAAQGNIESAIESMTTALEKYKTYNGIETSIFNDELAIVARERINSWRAML
ncbi:MAG: glycosyltransferase family 2 protein [Selenomonadaceae bacterium]|nr:glycosyltransferase family 2 protein [Selenomonadaceae bacterium]